MRAVRVPEKEEKKLTIDIFHAYGGDNTPGSTGMTFTLQGDLVNVINRKNVGTERFRRFCSVNGRKRPFSIHK